MSGQEQNQSPAPPPLPPAKGKFNAKWICVSILLPLLFGLVVPFGIYQMQKKDAEHKELQAQLKLEAEKKKIEAEDAAYERDLDVRISLLGAAWSIARPWSAQSLLRAGFNRNEFDSSNLPPEQDYESFRRAISESVESDVSGLPEANFDIAQFRSMVHRLNLPVNVDEMIYAAESGKSYWTQSTPPDDVLFLYKVVDSEYGPRGSRCFLAGYILQDVRTNVAGAFFDARMGYETTYISDDNPKTSGYKRQFQIMYDHLRPLYEEFGFPYPFPQDPSSMSNLEAAKLVHTERENYYQRIEGRISGQ
ncbi:MAG: hypothetical protein JNK63_06895 [Chthonomonas sp.]|nr:hypothetical protein [Chthonomonas sp.]